MRVIVESPYRALVGPVVTYLDVLDRAWPPDRPTPTTIVVLPEYVARHWWDRVLYNQTAKRLKASLVGREHTVIADVPYRRSDHPHVDAAPRSRGPPAQPMIGGRRPIKGRKPADRRVRVERPHAPYFRYTGPGQLQAKAAASGRGRGASARVATVKEWLIGRPLASVEDIDQRLSKRLALPIFSSDAISSSAYATEEILRVLVLAGAAALFLSIPVAIAISVLLAVVAISYRQVCYAFPGGGGAYAVARQELAPILGLVAAAALLIDYVMTVAVSTSSAMDQLISILPGLELWRRRSRRRDRPDHGRQPARPAGVGQPLRDPDLPVRRSWR